MIEATARMRRSNQTGFTLIEVLGAVAILGLSYIMLATSAIQGLRMIGESQRRIEASLLADQTLVEFELAIELGQPIDVGYEEREAGPFVVEIEILDMLEQYAAEPTDDEPQDLVAFLVAEGNGPFAPLHELNLLLGYLREVHITVRWQDAADEIEVTRTAYLYDQKASSEDQLASPPPGDRSSEEQGALLQRAISEALP